MAMEGSAGAAVNEMGEMKWKKQLRKESLEWRMDSLLSKGPEWKGLDGMDD